jgi:hypothetical protein
MPGRGPALGSTAESFRVQLLQRSGYIQDRRLRARQAGRGGACLDARGFNQPSG